MRHVPLVAHSMTSCDVVDVDPDNQSLTAGEARQLEQQLLSSQATATELQDVNASLHAQLTSAQDHLAESMSSCESLRGGLG